MPSRAHGRALLERYSARRVVACCLLLVRSRVALSWALSMALVFIKGHTGKVGAGASRVPVPAVLPAQAAMRHSGRVGSQENPASQRVLQNERREKTKEGSEAHHHGGRSMWLGQAAGSTMAGQRAQRKRSNKRRSIRHADDDGSEINAAALGGMGGGVCAREEWRNTTPPHLPSLICCSLHDFVHDRPRGSLAALLPSFLVQAFLSCFFLRPRAQSWS